MPNGSRALGASEVLNYTQTPDWDEKARELTDDRGVDCVVEIGGPGTIAMSLKALAVGGHISPNRSTGLWHGSSSRCPDLNTATNSPVSEEDCVTCSPTPGQSGLPPLDASRS